MGTADRIAIQVPVKMWDALKERAARDDVSASEALRRSLWLYTFIRGEQEKGAELILEKADGRVERIVTVPLA